jgi:hypothetical protein
MRTTILLAVLGMLAMAPPCIAAESVAPATATSPTISGMRVHLFRDKTATLSDDVLEPKHRGLWNGNIGADASHAALVVVEISGPPGGTYTGYFGPRSKAAVRVIARSTGRTAPWLDQSRTLPILNEQGKVYVPFMLYHDGCTPVRLTATITGAIAARPLEKSIDFACGE